jgi:hypothetical protein
MPQSWDMGHIFYFPSEGRHAENFYRTGKIQRLRPGLNPRTRVPESRMLTTRPPKPSRPTLKDVMFLRKYEDKKLVCGPKFFLTELCVGYDTLPFHERRTFMNVKDKKEGLNLKGTHKLVMLI